MHVFLRQTFVALPGQQQVYMSARTESKGEMVKCNYLPARATAGPDDSWVLDRIPTQGLAKTSARCFRVVAHVMTGEMAVVLLEAPSCSGSLGR